MFTISKFFQTPYNVDFVETKIGDETFLIRRMNGRERQLFNDTKTLTDRSIYVLANCLIDSETKKGIGERYAEQFIERYDALANILIEEIIELTGRLLEEEVKVWERAEKNSLMMNMNVSTADIAIVTDSTQEQRKSQKKS
ncbi:MAG: hypothetical protein Q4C95_11390 [Planctomycetia bacterium]|nr:hypothetical protein [Planctomycetia bacterium]